MPTIVLTLPTKETVRAFHATNSEGVAAAYFNGKRMGFNGARSKEQYESQIPTLQAALVNEINLSGMTFDAVVCAPSKDTDVIPYFRAVLERLPLRDISKNLTRKEEKKASRPETTVDDMIEEFVYTPDGREPNIRSILIVDESVATGKTIAAILHHLRAAGLPEDAKIAVAACVKMG